MNHIHKVIFRHRCNDSVEVDVTQVSDENPDDLLMLLSLFNFHNEELTCVFYTCKNTQPNTVCALNKHANKKREEHSSKIQTVQDSLC